MPNTPAKLRIYPVPDAWKMARGTVNAITDADLALVLGVAQSTVTRARLAIGDKAVGADFIGHAVHAFRDTLAAPFDYLFRVRIGGHRE